MAGRKEYLMNNTWRISDYSLSVYTQYFDYHYFRYLSLLSYFNIDEKKFFLTHRSVVVRILPCDALVDYFLTLIRWFLSNASKRVLKCDGYRVLRVPYIKLVGLHLNALKIQLSSISRFLHRHYLTIFKSELHKNLTWIYLNLWKVELERNWN